MLFQAGLQSDEVKTFIYFFFFPLGPLCTQQCFASPVYRLSWQASKHI